MVSGCYDKRCIGVLFADFIGGISNAGCRVFALGLLKDLFFFQVGQLFFDNTSKLLTRYYINIFLGNDAIKTFCGLLEHRFSHT